MKLRTAAVCAAALTVLACAELCFSNLSIETEKIELAPTGLPKEFDGLRIALVSDVHGRYSCPHELLLRLLKEAEPDIIAYTGDAVNDSRDSAEDAAELMRELCAIAPVYYAPGNHEYAARSENKLFAKFRDAGAIVLRGDSAVITRGSASITVVGADDPNGYGGEYPLKDALEGAEGFTILLCHRYDRADEAAELGASLMLAGHAHGGLVRLPFTDGVIGPGRVLFPKRTSGCYDVNGMLLVTSRGLGNAMGVPRVFNRFHLPVITLTAGGK